MDTIGKEAHGAVGFYLSGFIAPEAMKNAISACDQALRHFSWLKRKRLQHGAAQVELWSHHNPDESIYVDKFGNLFVLIGSPMNSVSWADAIEQLARQGDDAFELPWEGRCILIRLSPDGKNWTMWNDWCGSIPVFHTSVRGVPVASSLEPLVVAAAGFTPDDFSKRGIVEMLVHGHFLGTDTLFTEMRTLPPDSVSRWQEGKSVGSKVLWTLEPSDSRWDWGWDELADEMHDYTVKTIGDALKQHDKWILPLSGGMDSRLIACVGTELGVDMQAYTYGPATWCEPIYARQVARALDIPWQRVDVGTDYLADYTPMWLDWFGSSLHAHGMYQMPFLMAVREVEGMILDGFYGNNMAGGNHPSMGLLSEPGPAWHGFYKGYSIMWSVEDLKNLVTFDVSPVIGEMKAIIESQIATVIKWSFYHQRNAVDMWNRQQRFIFYQPMMYDYWKGVSTPFMNREYARFCLSLPRLALEGRRLQMEMLKRFWPEVAKIAGTYSSLPLIETKQFVARRVAAHLLPRKLRIGPLREFNPTPNMMEPDCVAKSGIAALWPLGETIQDVDDFFNTSLIERAIESAAKDQTAYMELPPIQAIAFRLMR